MGSPAPTRRSETLQRVVRLQRRSRGSCSPLVPVGRCSRLNSDRPHPERLAVPIFGVDPPASCALPGRSVLFVPNLVVIRAFGRCDCWRLASRQAGLSGHLGPFVVNHGGFSKGVARGEQDRGGFGLVDPGAISCQMRIGLRPCLHPQRAVREESPAGTRLFRTGELR